MPVQGDVQVSRRRVQQVARHFFGEHQRVDGQAGVDALVYGVAHEFRELRVHQALAETVQPHFLGAGIARVQRHEFIHGLLEGREGHMPLSARHIVGARAHDALEGAQVGELETENRRGSIHPHGAVLGVARQFFQGA